MTPHKHFRRVRRNRHCYHPHLEHRRWIRDHRHLGTVVFRLIYNHHHIRMPIRPLTVQAITMSSKPIIQITISIRKTHHHLTIALSSIRNRRASVRRHWALCANRSASIRWVIAPNHVAHWAHAAHHLVMSSAHPNTMWVRIMSGPSMCRRILLPLQKYRHAIQNRLQILYKNQKNRLHHSIQMKKMRLTRHQPQPQQQFHIQTIT